MFRTLLAIAASFTALARADNPFVQTIFTADPAPVVYNGRVYAFLDHDNTGATTYDMTDWRLFSTADMVNWQDHGSPLSLKSFSWAKANAWAPQVIARNDKFYFYVPVQSNTGANAIGVAVSDNILGPYKDALGKPLVSNSEIDPTVFIDDDGQAWLYYGNPDLYYIKLNSDMISYSQAPAKISLPSGAGFQEAPWAYKRNGTYYMIYAGTCCSENIRYMTGPSPTGPFTARGVIMPTQGKSFTNHEAIIDFQGHSYFFYHNGALPGGSGYQRSACVEEFKYNSDGSIPTIQMTTAGVSQLGSLNPYLRQEAETAAWTNGAKTEVCSEGGMDVTGISSSSYIKVKGVAFGTAGASSLAVRVAGTGSGSIAVRLGSTSGTLVGTCSVTSSGGSQTWKTVTCPISGAKGTSDLYFVFSGSGYSFNYWQFASANGSSASAPASSITTSAATSSATGTTTKPATTTTTSAPAQTTSSGVVAARYGQCGGQGWTGPTICQVRYVYSSKGLDLLADRTFHRVLIRAPCPISTIRNVCRYPLEQTGNCTSDQCSHNMEPPLSLSTKPCLPRVLSCKKPIRSMQRFLRLSKVPNARVFGTRQRFGTIS